MTSQSPLDRLAGPGNVLSKEAPDANAFAEYKNVGPHCRRTRAFRKPSLDNLVEYITMFTWMRLPLYQFDYPSRFLLGLTRLAGN